MPRRFRFRVAVVPFALTGLALLTHAAPPRPAVFPEGAAALVNDEVITEGSVRRELGCLECLHLPADRLAEARAEGVRLLVDRLLIDQHLRAAGYRVTKAEEDDYLDKLKADLKQPRPNLARSPADLHIPEVDLRREIAVHLRWVRYTEAKATDGELRKLFQEHRHWFDGSRVQARHILIALPSNAPGDVGKADQRLRAIRAAIETDVNAGLATVSALTDKDAREKERGRLVTELFSQYAREKSDCPSKAQGGDLGAFLRRGVVEEAFADAAFALRPFQLSDAVRTKFGYHLILVTGRTPGRDVSFEAVQEAVQSHFGEQLKARLASELRQKATVHVKPAG